MKEVFRNGDSALVGLYQSILEDAGIPTFVQNASEQEPSFSVFTGDCPILNVVNDKDYPEAMELLLSLKSASTKNQRIGSARQAAMRLEAATSTACWKCQSVRGAASSQP